MSKKELFNKAFQKFYDLFVKSELDEIIYGNSYWEFGERSIELIDPKRIKYKVSKKGKERYQVSVESPKDKLYGKGIITNKPKKVKKF